MKIRYFSAAFCCLVLSTTAMATGFHTVLKCVPQYPQPDQGYQVEVRASFGNPYLGHRPSGFQALVSEQTIAGPRAVRTYSVSYHSMDSQHAGPYYGSEGESFSLQVLMDGVPREDHKVLALMNGETNSGMRYFQRLMCESFASPTWESSSDAEESHD
jgi:hypothetical protein